MVKVHRNAVGTTIPFDKVYFFRRDDRPLIPSVFGYALVMPVDPALVEALYQLKPKKVSHLQYRRNDDAVGIATGLDGRKHNAQNIQDWWKTEVFEKYDLEDRVAVVPILTSKARKRLNPRYLSSKRWYNEQEQKKGRHKSNRPTPMFHVPGEYLDPRKKLPVQPAISELAYLATPLPAPDDKIRPLCSICPRMLRNLQGECVPGQLVCYKSLDFSKIGSDSEMSETAEVAE